MPETRGLTMTELNEIFGGKVTYETRNSYADAECTDELEEKLTCNKNLGRKRSSVANIAASKAAATAALSKVASAAAISRVASLARSMGAVGKENAEEDDENLLRQQSSSEDSSESEFVQQNCTTLSSEDTLDCTSDADTDDGMTMNV